MVIRSVHRLSCILLACAAHVHFHLLTCSIMSVTCVFSLTHMFVFLPRNMMCNILLSIFVCAAASLGGECLCFRAVCHCRKNARIADLPLQAHPNVTLEDVAVLGKCCPPGRDSFLNFCLVFVSDVVSLSQVDVAFNFLHLGVVDIYWCVVFHQQLCLRLNHLQTPIFTFIS